MTFVWLPGRYAMCRFPPDADVSDITASHCPAGGISAMIRTPDERAVLVGEQHVDPTWRQVEPGWIALRVAGVLEFSMVGVLARIASALAEAGVPICALSTFDTDIILVRDADQQRAREALRAVGSFVD